MKILDPFAVERLLFDAEQVGPLERPPVRELGPFEERVDQPRPLVHRAIGHERTRLIGSRQQPEQIEMDSPHERRVVTHVRRVDP